jgi:hypothetical protein
MKKKLAQRRGGWYYYNSSLRDNLVLRKPTLEANKVVLGYRPLAKQRDE